MPLSELVVSEVLVNIKVSREWVSGVAQASDISRHLPHVFSLVLLPGSFRDEA